MHERREKYLDYYDIYGKNIKNVVYPTQVVCTSYIIFSIFDYLIKIELNVS